jgi:hypothetical protein
VRSLLTVPLAVGERPFGHDVARSMGGRRMAPTRALSEKFAAHRRWRWSARLYREARPPAGDAIRCSSVVTHDLRNPISAIAMRERARDGWTSTEERGRSHHDVQTEWMNPVDSGFADVASTKQAACRRAAYRESPSRSWRRRCMFELEPSVAASGQDERGGCRR